jgi:hypothetical protein
MAAVPPTNGDIAQLTNVATELTVQISRLNRQYADQMVKLAEQQQKNRRVNRALILLAAIKVTVIIALVVTMFQLNAITDRLDMAQTTNRQKGLCPLYTVFYELTNTPEERKAGKARSANPESYDWAVATIHEGYRNMQCAKFRGDAPGLYKR